MRCYQLLLLSMISALFFGCVEDPDTDHFIDFTIVSSGTQTGLSGQQMRVVSDATQLSELLSAISVDGDSPNTVLVRRCWWPYFPDSIVAVATV